MKYIKTDAYVLHREKRDQKYAHVVLFSRDKGLLHVKVRGVQNITSKLASKLEPGQKIRADLYVHAEEVYILTGAELLQKKPELERTFESMNREFLLYEVLMKILAKESVHEDVFELMEKSMELFYGAYEEKSLLFFLINVLKNLGYVENVKFCNNCQSPLSQTEKIFVHPFELAFYCSSCPPSELARVIHLSALKVLYFYLEQPIEGAMKLHIPDMVHQELMTLITRAICDITGRPLESLQYF